MEDTNASQDVMVISILVMISLKRKYKTLKKKIIKAGPAGKKDTLHSIKDLKINNFVANTNTDTIVN